MGIDALPETPIVAYSAAVGLSYLLEPGASHMSDRQYASGQAVSAEVAAALRVFDSTSPWRIGLAGRYQFAWLTASPTRLPFTPRVHLAQVFLFVEYVARGAGDVSHGPRLGVGGAFVVDASSGEVRPQRQSYQGIAVDLMYKVSFERPRGFDFYFAPALTATRYLGDGDVNPSYAELGFNLFQATLLVGVRTTE